MIQVARETDISDLCGKNMIFSGGRVLEECVSMLEIK